MTEAPTIPRYALFAGQDYYPNGGWTDLMGCYETPEAAEADMQRAAKEKLITVEWWHIVDLRMQEIVKGGDGSKRKGKRK